MDFLNAFTEKPVRESGGSRASNRFDYQKNWSLCELLELHSNNSDYLMVFEHHDDIVVFNSQANPSEAIFYQVKSKSSGNWTIPALTKRKDGSPSVLEKLYQNHLNFPENASKLVFASNQPLSAKLKDGTKAVDLGKIKFSDLSSADKEKIHSNVEPENNNYCDLLGLQKIETRKNKLKLEDHTVFTKGKLVEFFEELHPESEIHVSLVYKTFFDEIRRKSNFEDSLNSVKDLVIYKGIGKSDFEKMIGAVVTRVSDANIWSEAHSQLQAEGFSFNEIRQIRSEWQNYIVAKMDATNEVHNRLCRDIQGGLNTTNSTLRELMESVSNSLSEDHSSEFSADYIHAAVLYEVFRNDPISEINTKPTEEAK